MLRKFLTISTAITLGILPHISALAAPAGDGRAVEDAYNLDAAPETPEFDQEDGGQRLGSAAWVLVVQAGRGPKGDLVPWEKTGPWAMAWRVPGDAAGTRYVPVFGDAEDREHVKPARRRLDGLGFLAGKYKAPAIAVVVREGDSVAVMGWRGGISSEWRTTPVPVSAPTEDARIAAVAMIGDIFKGRRGRDPSAPDQDRVTAKVAAYRDVAGEIRQYQIIVEGRTSSQALQRRIEKVEGLSISEIMTTPDGYDVVLDDRSGSAEPVERRLTQVGLPTVAAGSR